MSVSCRLTLPDKLLTDNGSSEATQGGLGSSPRNARFTPLKLALRALSVYIVAGGATPQERTISTPYKLGYGGSVSLHSNRGVRSQRGETGGGSGGHPQEHPISTPSGLCMLRRPPCDCYRFRIRRHLENYKDMQRSEQCKTTGVWGGYPAG